MSAGKRGVVFARFSPEFATANLCTEGIDFPSHMAPIKRQADGAEENGGANEGRASRGADRECVVSVRPSGMATEAALSERS